MSYTFAVVKQNDKVFYTITEVAKLLGIEKKLVSELVHSGIIPSINEGKKIVISKDELEKMSLGI